MKASHLLLAGSLFATTAFADFTITQQVHQEPAGGGQGVDMTTTTKVKGAKFRVDVNPQATTVIDTTTGEAIQINNADKEYTVIPGEIMKLMRQKAMEMSNPDNEEAPAKPEFKATGNKNTINGFACEEYVIESEDGSKTTLWITKDIPNGADLLKELQAISAQISPNKNAVSMEDLPGFPIQTIIESANPAGKTTVTVSGLSQDAVADSDFQAPAGYKEKELPEIPGQQPAEPAQP